MDGEDHNRSRLGEATKKLFLRDFNIAFVNEDVTAIADSVTDDITFDMVGDKIVRGKKDFMETLEPMKDNPIQELVIHKIVTHGKEGVVNGELKMQDGKNFAFCDVYDFNSAKGNSIKSLQSYVIELPSVQETDSL